VPAAFASASATGATLDAVLEEISARALDGLGPGDPPDLAVLFVTPDFGASHGEAGPRVRKRTGAHRLVGCTAGGVIGSEAEREGGRSAALLLARMPDTDVRAFRVRQPDLEGFTSVEMTRSHFGIDMDAQASFLLLVDPFSLDAEGLLARVNDGWCGRPVVGGMASGAQRPGGHALWLDGETHREGAVGIALRAGGVSLRPLVSQGCRPIGRRYVVTKVEGTRIRALAGKPAAEALQETFESLSPADQALARTSLHVGLVADESRPEFHRGDFLIRNLLGVTPEDGALVVGAEVEVGHTVQFQLRDAATATEDLVELLDMEATVGKPAAGLLFSCGGRGSHMFGEPDHDLALVRERLGRFPLAGFFCNGEIGPVGTRNFLHGFTSSMALFSVV
jgi:small ligand-binding sensory domain FIST